MARIQCPLPPDLATLEEVCDEWAQWAAELEGIKAQFTDQAKLSAIQNDIHTIQAEVGKLQQRLQQRIQDRNEALELHRARLVRHLRQRPSTVIPHPLQRGIGFGGEDGGERNQAPPSTTSDGTGRPIRLQVARTDGKSVGLVSLAAAALLHYDIEAAGSTSFFEESSLEADCATTICSSPSGSIFNHGAPHSSPAIPDRIKQENEQSPGGLATYRSSLPAYGQTPQFFNQPKPGVRQNSLAQRLSPTLPFSVGKPQTTVYDDDNHQDVW
ncbi:hypothetical protein F4808DRAFT_443971 [Astrocystis sublimbata]|nr:hypothetical protein F4808DRAFT_443971 [Astrocystis sublimbata]